jgi:hypothetical protein
MFQVIMFKSKLKKELCWKHKDCWTRAYVKPTEIYRDILVKKLTIYIFLIMTLNFRYFLWVKHERESRGLEILIFYVFEVLQFMEIIFTKNLR